MVIRTSEAVRKYGLSSSALATWRRRGLLKFGYAGDAPGLIEAVINEDELRALIVNPPARGRPRGAR